VAIYKWWNGLGKTVHIMVMAVAALISSGMAMWPHLEPFAYAHRGYVRDQMELTRKQIDAELTKMRRDMMPISMGLYDTQLSIARSRRSALNDRIITLEIEAPKSDTSQELIARRQQIESLKDERSDVEAEIKRIQILRDKN
jgi:hypothetical protein